MSRPGSEERTELRRPHDGVGHALEEEIGLDIFPQADRLTRETVRTGKLARPGDPGWRFKCHAIKKAASSG